MAESGLVQLPNGSSVERWLVSKKLGEGAFGAVYKVSYNGQDYAMKLEGCNEKIQVLKMEVYVLGELGVKGRHFCKIEDKGKYGTFNYVVMTLVGKSLQDLRKSGPGQHMSLGTALGCGIQALEALEDLHGIGYLHRDVKPGNYTTGRAELNELRKVYVLDFGMCRKFTNDQGIIRKPRAAAGFRGTVRYAPIACHKNQELCRKDDVETWLYMQVEITVGQVPWKTVTDMNAVGRAKVAARNGAGLQALFAGCPQEYQQMIRIIDAVSYYDPPPYDQLYQLCRAAMASNGVQEFPYDWEKPGFVCI